MRAGASLLALALPATAAAQDVAGPAEEFAVAGTLGGRLVVESEGASYLCDVAEEPGRAVLADCLQIVAEGAGAAGVSTASAGAAQTGVEPAPGAEFEQAPEPAPREVVADLAQAEVAQALLRVLRARECRFAVDEPGAEDGLVAAVAGDLGLSSGTLEAAGPALFVKVDRARLTLMSDGRLRMNDAGTRMLSEGCE